MLYIFSHDLSVNLICQNSENSYRNMIVAVKSVTRILIGKRKYATICKANLLILMYNQMWNVTTH